MKSITIHPGGSWARHKIQKSQIVKNILYSQTCGKKTKCMVMMSTKLFKTIAKLRVQVRRLGYDDYILDMYLILSNSFLLSYIFEKN